MIKRDIMAEHIEYLAKVKQSMQYSMANGLYKPDDSKIKALIDRLRAMN